MKPVEEKFKRDLVELLPRLRRLGLLLTGDPQVADDLSQATCERALSRRHQWRLESRLDSWVFSIMRSIWKNELRAVSIRQGRGVVSSEEFPLEAAGHSAETAVFMQQVYSKVMALPEGQRVTLLLVYVEGYGYQEAADILELPVGTVMSRLARARLAIAQQTDFVNAPDLSRSTATKDVKS